MGSQRKKRPVSTKAAVPVPPRGADQTNGSMATTVMSQPTTPRSVFGPRLGQVPPSPTSLPSTGGMPFDAANTFWSSLNSPTDFSGSSTSWSSRTTSHAGISAVAPYPVENSTNLQISDAPYSERLPFQEHNDPPHGIKRAFDATRGYGSHSLNTLLPKSTSAASSTMNEGSSRRTTISPSLAQHRASIWPTIFGPKARCSIHVRQHPRAARAGPDGKDRRTVDPPPVLQLLINDFDVGSEQDMRLMHAHDWVVHAKLVSADTPPEDAANIVGQTRSDDSNAEKTTKLLLGTTVSGPLFCRDDPDPEYAVRHPITRRSSPPSPTERFMPKSTETPQSASTDQGAYQTFPGAFFIFADLSIRKAGQYRLEFRLMKMEPEVLMPGGIVPTISVATTDVFNVVNAKDFDQVQPSTNLVKGLLDRGAAYPLKLKKGLREGQRRRRGPGSDDNDDEEGDNNNNEGAADTSDDQDDEADDDDG